MRKIYSLMLLGGLLLFGAQSVQAKWVGNSEITINGVTKAASAFNGNNLGTVSHLIVGGKSEVYDNGSDWKGGTMIMGYKFDSGSDQTITLTYYDFGDNNNRFNSTPAALDISGLTAGDHKLRIWFVSYDIYGQNPVYDSNGGANYVIDFTIEQATISLASACTYDSKYYGTYSNASAFEVPSDLTVAAVSVAAGVLTVTPYSTGDIVTAGEGVLVSSTTDGDHTIYLTGATGTSKDGNMLIGTGDAGIDDTEMDDLADHKFYRLTMHNGTQIGFYWGAANGAAFDLGANKAYLAVPDNQTGLQAPSRFWIEDEEQNATDIQNIEASEKAVKFIKNGQLFIQKDGVVYDVTGRIAK